ncbi:HNH endonuclease [Streptomyces sp. NPDC057148]|uniref:HNH endonuclease n=1 Tax=unclassified Streptomyces TaxID=2593676 RepID=UPI00363047BE
MSSRHRAGHMRGDKGRRKRIRIARQQGNRCFYCRTRFKDAATEGTFDHYLPYTLWPRNVIFNLVVACKPCNVRKGDTLPLGLLLVLLPWQAVTAPGTQVSTVDCTTTGTPGTVPAHPVPLAELEVAA